MLIGGIALANSAISKAEKMFILHGAISKNIYDTAWHKFFSSMRKDAEFKRSGKSINEYVSLLIINGIITFNELNEFLFKELFFGMHRDVLLYRISNNVSFSKEEILKIISEKFGKSSCDYNELARTVFLNQDSSKDDDLSAIKLQYSKEGEKIEKIKLIFVKRMRYTIEREQKDKEGVETKVQIFHYENSYFPIEIDLINGIVTVKNAPKTYLDSSNNKNITIAKSYIDKVFLAFEIEVTSYQTIYQRALYNMCKVLLEDVIKKKSEYELNEMNDIIDRYVKETESKMSELKIDISILNKALSQKSRSTFNIKHQISNIIENIIITKILIDASGNSEGIEGLISYIKFKDRSAVNAVLKTEKRRETLLDSQSYLDLRKTLKECRYVEKLRVIWFKNKEELQLKYETTNMMYLSIHFYERLFEEELIYAIRRVEEFSNMGQV